MKRFSVGFVTDLKGNVALICKNRPEWQKGLLNGVGGHIEPNETPYEAMVREFEEETSVLILKEKWKHTITMYCESSDSLVYFFTSKLEDLTSLKSVTDEKIIITRIRSLPENIIPNLLWLIPLSLSSCQKPMQIITKDAFDKIEKTEILGGK